MTTTPTPPSPAPRVHAGDPSNITLSGQTIERVQQQLASKPADWLSVGSESEIREYVNEHHVETGDKLLAEVDAFCETHPVRNKDGLVMRIPKEGAAGHLVARTSVFVYDLPELPPTAFITPSNRIFFHASFLERMLAERHIPGCVHDPFRFVLRHEAEHGLRQHFERFTKESPRLVNLAGDMVINLSICISDCVETLRKANPKFKLPVTDTRSSPEWRKLRDTFENYLKGVAPSIKDGIGFSMESFDKYALMSTREVLARMKTEVPERKADDPSRKVDVRDVMEGVAQDMERLASHPMTLHRAQAGYVPGDPLYNPNDLSALCPILAEDVRRAGETLSGQPTSANKHNPSPSSSAGVSGTYTAPMPFQAMVDVLGRLRSFDGSMEYSTWLDEDHRTHANGNPLGGGQVNTGDTWIDSMFPSERLRTALDLIRQVLANNLSPSASQGPSAEKSIDIHNPYHQPQGAPGNQGQSQQGADGQSKASAGEGGEGGQQKPGSDAGGNDAGAGTPQQGATAAEQARSQASGSDAKASTAGQPQPAGTNKQEAGQPGAQAGQQGAQAGQGNSLQGAAPSIEVGQTATPNASLGKVTDTLNEHQLTSEELGKILKQGDYEDAIKRIGVHSDDISIEESRAADQSRRTLEEIKSQSKALSASGGPPMPGGHCAEAAYQEMEQYYKPIFSLAGVLGEAMEPGLGTREMSDNPHALMSSPMWDEVGLTGMYLPADIIAKQDRSMVVFVVDTSGSVSDDLLTRFYSEIYANVQAMEQNPAAPEVILVGADTTARNIQVVTEESASDFLSKAITVGGRGGTDFTAATLSVLEQFASGRPLEGRQVQSIVYFTDGGDAPPNSQVLHKAAEAAGMELPPMLYIIPEQYRSDRFCAAVSDVARVVYYDEETLRELGTTVEIDLQELQDAIQAKDAMKVDDNLKSGALRSDLKSSTRGPRP